MARYTGPKTKIARKFGEPIFGDDKVLAKKNYPPGQHGLNRRRKTSEYGTQLREKQKVKYTYGVLERPGDYLPLAVGQTYDDVVERGVYVKLTHCVYFHVSLLCCDCLFCHTYLLFCSFLLVCNCFLAALAGAGIVLGALSAHRKTQTVTYAAVAADVHESLDVQLYL